MWLSCVCLHSFPFLRPESPVSDTSQVSSCYSFQSVELTHLPLLLTSCPVTLRHLRLQEMRLMCLGHPHTFTEISLVIRCYWHVVFVPCTNFTIIIRITKPNSASPKQQAMTGVQPFHELQDLQAYQQPPRSWDSTALWVSSPHPGACASFSWRSRCPCCPCRRKGQSVLTQDWVPSSVRVPYMGRMVEWSS